MVSKEIEEFIRLRRKPRVYPWMSATKIGGSAKFYGGNAKMLIRRMSPNRQAISMSADNPDEYAEIIEENFGMSYESG